MNKKDKSEFEAEMDRLRTAIHKTMHELCGHDTNPVALCNVLCEHAIAVAAEYSPSPLHVVQMMIQQMIWFVDTEIEKSKHIE